MKRVLLFVLLVVLVTAAVVGVPLYRAIFEANTSVASNEAHELLIRDGMSVDQLVASLNTDGVLKRPADFQRVAKLMSFGPSLKPGRYLVSDGMTNRELIGKLRLGDQDEVKLIFNKFRTKDRFAGHISSYLDIDSAAFHAKLTDPAWLKKYGLTNDEVFTRFIPNTYFFKWNTSADGFMERMLREHKDWWSQRGRLEKAEALGMTPEEVYVLASIVEEESIMADERPRIAGLYLNRLKIGMALQADPTIKFALGRFELTRVLFKHIDDAEKSPYSTYAHPGLPPGPICIPSTNAIDAVLNAEDHNYLYMCAKADLSGYHAFAKSNAQHARNAALYQAEMNRRGY